MRSLNRVALFSFLSITTSITLANQSFARQFNPDNVPEPNAPKPKVVRLAKGERMFCSPDDQSSCPKPRLIRYSGKYALDVLSFNVHHIFYLTKAQTENVGRLIPSLLMLKGNCGKVIGDIAECAVDSAGAIVRGNLVHLGAFLANTGREIARVPGNAYVTVARILHAPFRPFMSAEEKENERKVFNGAYKKVNSTTKWTSVANEDSTEIQNIPSSKANW